MSDKFEKMARFIPSMYKPDENPYVKGLLTAWSNEDNAIVQSIQDAKEQIYVKYAQLGYLDALGSNVGVYRTSASTINDDQFRNLIPALSWYPKQVRSTLVKILEVFFGTGNPLIKVFEVNPNEIVIQIPSSTPLIIQNLKGTTHIKGYNGVITAVDDALKTLEVTFEKSLAIDELASAEFCQDLKVAKIVGNTAGTNAIVQLTASADVGAFVTGDNFAIANASEYQGPYITDPDSEYTLTKLRGALGQVIELGNVYATLLMEDASNIPDDSGEIVLSYGTSNEEKIEYFGRPNNSTLLIDPSYTFLKDHSIGEVVNYVAPYEPPRIDGSDYSAYIVGVLAARVIAQDLVESARAAGVVIRWEFVEPICSHY